jgi:pimeloyl-ACP methyl ester carboxylesterase
MTVKGINRAALIGESMGGGIALQFALQYPHQVEKMVLADNFGIGKEVSIYLRVMSLPIVGDLLGRPSREGSAQLIRQLFHNQDLVTDQWIDEDYELSLLPGAQHCLFNALRSMVNIWGCRSDAYGPIFDHLEEIEVPTLVVWGAQDQILPVAHAHLAVKRLPNARLHIFDACGHVPNIEHAEEFNALVTDFLSNG